MICYAKYEAQTVYSFRGLLPFVLYVRENYVTRTLTQNKKKEDFSIDFSATYY